MNRFITVVFFLISAGLMLIAGCSQNTEPVTIEEDIQLNVKNGDIIPGSYIVVLESNPASFNKFLRVEVAAVQLLSDLGISDYTIEHVYSTAIQGFSVKMKDEDARKLQQDSRIKWLEPDRVVMLAKPGKPGGGSSGQVIPWGITRVGGPGDGTGKRAWIIDTGIDLDHPDLNVDLNLAYSVFTKGSDASPDDGNGHGTHVAGTVAALNNTIGVVGVAAGATVVPVKVLNRNGSGSYSGVIAGVDYVASHAAPGDAANMSLGGPVSDALDQAVLNAASKGIKFAIAAGNESQDANNSSPARVNHPNVYTVSAIDSKDVFASFSNYGNPPVDFASPGVSILSTYKGGTTATMSGTSMASPHVCGLLLLGNPRSDGYAINDPDGVPDPIAHR